MNAPYSGFRELGPYMWIALMIFMPILCIFCHFAGKYAENEWRKYNQIEHRKDPPLTLAEFKIEFTPQKINSLRKAYVFSGSILTLYAIGIIYVYLNPESSSLPSENQINAFTVILCLSAIVTAGLFFAGIIAYQLFMLRLSSKSQPDKTSISTEDVVAWMMKAYLVRIALFTGAGFMGLLPCALLASHGIIKLHPQYWLSFMPYFIMLELMIRTFPAADKIEGIFREKTGINT